jgi:hypothetical protein
MNLKGIAKGLGVLNASAIIVTAVMGWFLGRNSVPELFDIASYVALGMGALGSLMFVGATSGSDGSAERAATVSAQPRKLMDALWTDRNAGISTGALFVLGGFSWGAFAWILSELLSRTVP